MAVGRLRRGPRWALLTAPCCPAIDPPALPGPPTARQMRPFVRLSWARWRAGHAGAARFTVLRCEPLRRELRRRGHVRWPPRAAPRRGRLIAAEVRAAAASRSPPVSTADTTVGQTSAPRCTGRANLPGLKPPDAPDTAALPTAYAAPRSMANAAVRSKCRGPLRKRLDNGRRPGERAAAALERIAATDPKTYSRVTGGNPE